MAGGGVGMLGSFRLCAGATATEPLRFSRYPPGAPDKAEVTGGELELEPLDPFDDTLPECGLVGTSECGAGLAGDCGLWKPGEPGGATGGALLGRATAAEDVDDPDDEGRPAFLASNAKPLELVWMPGSLGSEEAAATGTFRSSHASVV